MSDYICVTHLQGAVPKDVPDAKGRVAALKPLDKQLRPLGGPGFSDAQRDAEKMAEVAHDFEALLVKQIFASMRNTFKKDEHSFGESTFTSMLDEQLAQAVADGGGLGLSDAMLHELQQRTQALSQPVDTVMQRGGDDEHQSTQR